MNYLTAKRKPEMKKFPFVKYVFPTLIKYYVSLETETRFKLSLEPAAICGPPLEYHYRNGS